jgi:hypothetical protein
MDLTMMDRVGDRWEKMEGSCSASHSPQWAAVPVKEEEYAHHQEKQLYFCDTSYWSPTQNNKYQVPQKYSCFS